MIDGCKKCGGEKDKYDKYCSLKCWYDIIRKPRPKCKHCGNECKRMVAIYCSISCKNYDIYKDKTKHPKWNNDASTKYQKLRNSVWKELEQWRNAILDRDKVCIQCGSEEKLQADHIKPFAYFEELRFELSNGRTLCYECHKKTDTFGGGAYKHKQNI